MFKYSRKDVLEIASTNNFLVNNTEKFLRLCGILDYISKSRINSYLVLKGGTAINIFLLDLKRLSVDIDFDFAKNISKEELPSIREIIKEDLVSFMLNEGYALSDKSKFTYALDSFVFHYITTSGSGDVLKIEINYINRLHVLDLMDDYTITRLDEVVKVKRLSNEELIASKVKALITRTSPRDLYDVYNILNSIKFDKIIVRKITIFYVLLGSKIPVDFINLIIDCLNRIMAINYNKIKTTLIPVTNKKEKIDIDVIKKSVYDSISKFQFLSENEIKCITHFNQGLYDFSLLFENIETNELIKHPMLYWKTVIA